MKEYTNTDQFYDEARLKRFSEEAAAANKIREQNDKMKSLEEKKKRIDQVNKNLKKESDKEIIAKLKKELL